MVSTYLQALDPDRFKLGLCVWRDRWDYPVPDRVDVWKTTKEHPWDSPGCIVQMARIIRRWQPDIVFSHLHFVNLLTGIAVRLSRHRCRWIPCLHSNPQNRESAWSNWLAASVFRHADRICTVSQGIGSHLSSWLGIPSHRIKTLYNPTDFGQIEQSIRPIPRERGEVPTIITVGRLVEAKDHNTLLEAVAELRESRPVKLVIVGDGPLRHRLERRAGELGIGRDVAFTGYVPNPFPLMARADVFALTSRWEGFGCVLVEAMACGLACVSTRCPHGPAEIIDQGKTGLLVPVGAPGELASALEELIDDPGRRQELADAGQREVQRRFSVAQRVRSLERLFEKTVQKRQP